MKNFIFLFLVSGLVCIGCGNDTSQDEDTASPNTPGVQNVNGNLPDTSNAVTLEQPARTDSSAKTDTLRR